MYLLYKQDNHQKKEFGFQDFFPMDYIVRSQKGLKIISTQQFLELVAMRGQLRNQKTGQIMYPPMNRTVWDMDTVRIDKQLNPYLRQVGYVPMDWNPDDCLAAFPSTPQKANRLQETWDTLQREQALPRYRKFIGNPAPVYASSVLRLQENWRRRTRLCLYNVTMQNELLIHFPGKRRFGGRLLTQFYMYLFFENWRQAAWTARFVRDQLRYNDEIQCAAARIVQAVRQRARSVDNPYGDYDAFHVRRGDFQVSLWVGVAMLLAGWWWLELTSSLLFVCSTCRHECPPWKFTIFPKTKYPRI